MNLLQRKNHMEQNTHIWNTHSIVDIYALTTHFLVII